MASTPSSRPEAQVRRSPPAYSVLVPARGLGIVGVAVIGGWLALMVLDRGRSVLALLVGAVVAAILAEPLVRSLDRALPRGLALAGVALGGICVVIALTATVAWDLDRQVDALAEDLRAAIDALPADSGIAEAASDVGLVETVDDLVEGFAAQVVVGDDDPLAVAGRISRVVVVAVLAAFLLHQGPPLLESTLRRIRSASTREELRGAIDATSTRGGTFVRRTLVVSAAHGAVVGIAASSAGLPGGISLGAWAAVAVTAPVLGGPLAWAPVVAVAWAGDAQPAVFAALGVGAVVVDRIVRSRWVAAALRVGPLLTLVGLGAGIYALGIPGAVVGLFAVAAVAAASLPDATDVGEVVEDLIDGGPGEDAAAGPGGAGGGPTEDGAAGEGSANPVLSADGVVRLQLSGRTAAVAVVLSVSAVGLVRLASDIRPLLVWLAVGMFIAFGLDRPVSALERRPGMHRVVAVALVVVVVVGAVTALAVLAGPSVTDTADEIAADAPDAVASLESLPVVGDALAEMEASERLEEELTRLPERLSDSGLVERLARAAGDGAIGAFWTISVVLAALLDGPRLVDVARRRVPVHRRRVAVRFGRAAHETLSNVAAAAAFVATLNGTVVLTIALVLGVPLAPVLAVWAAWWNFIPQIGGFVGASPLVLLAVAQGPWHGVAAVLAFLTYQTVENHVIQPAIGSRAVHVPPLLILVGVLLGGALFGFVGAILSGPALGLAKVAFTQLSGAPPPRVEDRIAPVAGGSVRGGLAVRDDVDQREVRDLALDSAGDVQSEPS